MEIYKGVTQLELVVASNVKQASARVSAGSGRDLKQDEAARLLEQALLKQAGVIITSLDGKKASVTYNDRLEIAETSGRP